MANRSKRRAVQKSRHQENAHIQSLLREAKQHHKDRKASRKKERADNRIYRSLSRWNIPNEYTQDPYKILVFKNLRKWQHEARDLGHKWDWNTNKSIKGFIQHMFVKYAVPAFMYQVWWENNSVHINWFIHLTKGQNIRKAQNLPFPVSKKMANWFLMAPDHFSVFNALRWAQVRALGGSDKLAKNLLRSRLGYVSEHEAFWKTVIQYLINNGQRLKADIIEKLISYIHFIKFQSGWDAVGQKPIKPEFEIKGRSLPKLLHEMENWIALMEADRSCFHGILTMGLSTFKLRRGGQFYQFTPLMNEAQLIEEGQKMHHCVASYDHACSQGLTTIWSMTLGRDYPKRLLTIELGPNRQIMQIRGFANRNPMSHELELIDIWASEVGINRI